MKAFLALISLFLISACVPPRNCSYDYRGCPYPNIAPRTVQPPAVLMYSTQSCGLCQQARAYFASRGIFYVEYDIYETEEGRRFDSIDNSGVPVIFICGQRMDGWGIRSFEAFYARCYRG